MVDGRDASDAGDGDVVAAVRTFNRTYTPRIGVLDESFLGTGMPLGCARLLYEVGVDEVTVLALRRRLGLDSGYLSRLLRRLETAGLAAVVADPHDRRRRVARLTAKGRRTWHRLDKRSDQVAADVVAGLSPRQQRELANALAAAERLIRLGSLQLELVAADDGEAIWAMSEYFAELARRFTNGFDPGDALTADVPAYSASNGGGFLIGRIDDRVVACGGLMRFDRSTVEIKRMWVHPDWRAGGVGRRTLAALEQHAAGCGYGRVVLDTNAALTEAIAMYQRSGYRAIARYNDNPYAMHWFEKTDLPA